jgi:hypothetical protein
MAIASDQAEMRPDAIALDEAEGRLEEFRRKFAALMVGLGVVATFAWIAVLGWLAARAVRLIL